MSKKQISGKKTSNEKVSKMKGKKTLGETHRPSISTDFSLSLEFWSLLSVNRNKEENNNERNSKASKNKLIKVNTKRNTYFKNLSLINQSKTNKKNDNNNNKNNEIEKNELFKNISEINIFKNRNINSKNIEIYDINKVIYIQNWWKNILFIKNKEAYSILILIKNIKKYILKEIFMLIKNNFPSINYFLHKWNNIINKRNIVNQIIINANKIKKIYITKTKHIDKSKISPIKNINKDKNLNSKKYNKSNKILNNKKKFISITTNNNNNTDNSKLKEKSDYCQTTKHNINNKINYINIDINRHKKKGIPYSPKSNLNTQRYNSPLNILTKKTQGNNSSLSKKTKKNTSRIFLKKEEKNKKKEKKSNKKSKNVINKIKDKKNKGQNIINAKLDNIISHNNSISKNETQSNYENNLSLPQNQNSQFNNYILNINRKEKDLSLYYNNYSRGEKNNNKIMNDDNINLLINKNSKSQYSTESNCNKVNSVFKVKNNKSNSKVYENCLYKDSKYKNLCEKDKKDLFSKTNKENKSLKNKNNNIPINKHVIFHKKEKEKISLNKEFSNHKKNVNYNISISASNVPMSEANSTLSKVSSIETNSNNRRKLIFNDIKIRIETYFNFWKEYANKKNILKKLFNFSKFVYNINHYQNIILLKNTIQKLVRSKKNSNFFEFIMKLIYKMIIKILTTIYEYKKNNMKEIKIFKKNNYNNILNSFQRGKGDIINNININNYIHYDDYNILQKRKARSPHMLSKVIEFKTTNNNPYYDNYNAGLTMSNSNSDKLFDFYKLNKNINNNEDLNSLKINDETKNIIKINNEILKKNNSGYLNNKVLQFNAQKDENGVIIDQINQLKMVFNLLERHNFNNNKETNSLLNCFNKWKLYSLNNKAKDFDKNIVTPRISEKIINLKPFQTSKILNNVLNQNQNIDISLKKNFSLSKMSPKIINVINVQNFNENNNYNYNFKYLPIKDIPIYPLKSRHSYAYNNLDKFENINTGINNEQNNKIKENEINTSIINNNISNINPSPLMLLNENKPISSKIVYHKKKLGSTFINNNFNFNFNNNVDNVVNNSNFNNCYYKIDKSVNYDNSSLLFYDQNQSDILLSNYNRIYSNDKNNSLNMAQTVFREKSFKDIRSFASHPEEKFGFKKLNQIEEKEINFDNANSKKLYIKKQHFEGKKSVLNQVNLKSNINMRNENIYNNNLIKCLNIQFGKTCKELIKKDKLNNNIDETNKCITISEDNFDKNKLEGEKGKVSLKKKTYKNIHKKNININIIENKINSIKNLELSNKLNKALNYKNITEQNNDIVKKDKINTSYSFGINQSILEEFQITTLRPKYSTI